MLGWSPTSEKPVVICQYDSLLSCGGDSHCLIVREIGLITSGRMHGPKVGIAQDIKVSNIKFDNMLCSPKRLLI